MQVLYDFEPPTNLTRFYHAFNHSSIILASKRSPKEYTELLGDVGVPTAILDRPIHRAEIVHPKVPSYK
ncbi:ATP-binding protein [Peribacillus frigoritolerans]|uniref:ATP-binding protein n=1 Tax=Peribacillus castrilensis TaxID=2897690 RepID=UPI003DA2C0A7